MQHYLLKEKHSYEEWRAQKLYNYPNDAQQLIIELNNPINLMDKELLSIKSSCSKTNMAIYRCTKNIQNDRNTVTSIARQLGMHQLDANVCADEDRISVITDSGAQASPYIPYTNKPLNWHTDGYYNAHEQRIHAFIMHCARPARSGGENMYLDPEIAYILLRDQNPDYISALMQDDVMRVPANKLNEKQIRPAQSGPVFYIDDTSQALCMRYTARKRNIVWKQDKAVQHALAFLHDVLQDSPYIFHYSLKAGEGVICNNVLHNRSAFNDDQDESKKRMLFRGRFYNRVTSNQNTLN
jgi:alpha-ketoglutarate-dependent taurine dioxygenase